MEAFPEMIGQPPPKPLDSICSICAGQIPANTPVGVGVLHFTDAMLRPRCVIFAFHPRCADRLGLATQHMRDLIPTSSVGAVGVSQ